MKLIEALGPPGIGKSTIISEAIKKQPTLMSARQASGILLVSDLLLEPKTRNPGHAIANAFLLASAAMGGKGARSKLGWRAAVSEIERTNHCLKKLGPNLGFIDKIAENWLYQSPTGDKLESLYMTLKEAENRVKIGQSKIKRVVVSEGSRILRTVASLVGKSEERDAVVFARKYRESKLAPDMVLWFDARAETIIERIKERASASQQNKRNIQHEGMSDNELITFTREVLRVNDRAVGYLRESGLRIQKIDTNENKDQSVANCIKAINELESE